jgi:hypothetical protein
MAFLGPDTEPMGERTLTAPVTEGQIASTIAALLGENFNAEVASAGVPVKDVLEGAIDSRGGNRSRGAGSGCVNPPLTSCSAGFH